MNAIYGKGSMRANVKYTAIFAKKDKYSISHMCEFFEVSRRGYYTWLKRKDNFDKDEIIANLIAECQKKTRQTYDYRRVKTWLLRETGLVINHKAVLRIMRKYNLLSEIRKPRPLYQRQSQFAVYEDKIRRDFNTDKKNQKWVTDISYIHTKQGVLWRYIIIV